MGSCDDKCCLCIDLRVGCLIIGYLSLAGEILALIFTSMLAMTGAALFVAENDEDSHIEGEAGVMILIIAAVLLLFLTLFLAFTIVLLVGIHQNKRGHVKAYLIYSIIFQVIYFIVFLASFASPPIQVGSVLQKVFTIALNLYFLFVVGKFYRKMDEHKRGPAIYTA